LLLDLLEGRILGKAVSL